MAWWGKLVGGALGFAMGGPIGAAVGAFAGHGFDRGLEQSLAEPDGPTPPPPPTGQERAQSAFFVATFAVMGHLAKSDGQVSPPEIALATQVMDELGLSADQKVAARTLFREGRAPSFDLNGVLDQLRRECRFSRHMTLMFLEIQVHAAIADGHISPPERQLLQKVCARLGLPLEELAAFERMVGAQAQSQTIESPAEQLANAYATLKLEPTASDDDVKRSYRRLMNQHHPDKLAAKGLPEEMMQLATDRTRAIKSAYDTIRNSREA